MAMAPCTVISCGQHMRMHLIIYAQHKMSCAHHPRMGVRHCHSHQLVLTQQDQALSSQQHSALMQCHTHHVSVEWVAHQLLAENASRQE